MNNSHNTLLSYRNSFDNLIRIIGDKQISFIGKSEIEDYKSKRSKEVNLISTNIDIRNIKAMFNKLVEFELLEFSKISTIKQFKIENKRMLAIDSGRYYQHSEFYKRHSIKVNSKIHITYC